MYDCCYYYYMHINSVWFDCHECIYTHYMYCRRFQDLKEYADELEAVFKSLLDIREVVKRKKNAIFLHVLHHYINRR